jgi:hypothetical protein
MQNISTAGKTGYGGEMKIKTEKEYKKSLPADM